MTLEEYESLLWSEEKEKQGSICETGIFGTKYWYNSKRQLHRLDGPAVEYADGYKAWYVEGKCHRLDGPAIEWANGFKEWWIEGK